MPCLCVETIYIAKKYLCDINFLQQYETAIMNYNCFGYRSLPISDCTTWQEEGLLAVRKGKLSLNKILKPIIGQKERTKEELLAEKEYYKKLFGKGGK